MRKILIADDESDIVGLIGRIVQLMGYAVLTAYDGEAALKIFRAELPDLAILDVMMPKKDGWEVLQAIRNISEVPVIMLTALSSVDDHVKGFSYGADDYILKPFDNRVVKSRIEAVMRRYVISQTSPGAAGVPPPLFAGVLEINNQKKEVCVHGKPIKLTRKEYEFVRLLVSEPERVFSPEEIIEHLWSKNAFVTAADVQQCVYLLRRKIEIDPKNPEIILNVRGFGYRVASEELP